MKYLNALLKGEKNLPLTRDDEPQKPLKPVSAVFAVPQPRCTGKNEPEAWPRFKCGRPEEIEAVEPSLDGERLLTFWHCEPCQSYTVTPSTIKEPPRGWATKTRQ